MTERRWTPEETALADQFKKILQNRIIVRCTILGMPGRDREWTTEIHLWSENAVYAGELFKISYRMKEPSGGFSYAHSKELSHEFGDGRLATAKERKERFADDEGFVLCKDNFLSITGKRMMMLEALDGGLREAKDLGVWQSRRGIDGLPSSPSSINLMMHYARMLYELRQTIINLEHPPSYAWGVARDNLICVFARFSAFLEERRRDWSKLGIS